jgi:hypothetical protein
LRHVKKSFIVNSNTGVGDVVTQVQRKAIMPPTRAQRLPKIAGMRKLIPRLTAGEMVWVEVEAALLVLVAVVLVLVLVVFVLLLAVLVFAFFEVMLWARRVELPHEVSSPEGEKTADSESQETDVDWKVGCEEDNSVLVTDSRDMLMKGTRDRSLIEPTPGGEVRPEADSQPLGRAEAEGESVATQGQTSGVTQVEVSLCVPLQGMGIPEAVAVIVGADWVSVGSSAELPLILPPLEIMDSHEPDLSP